MKKSSGMPLVISFTVGLFLFLNFVVPKAATEVSVEIPVETEPVKEIKKIERKSPTSGFFEIYNRYDKKPDKKSFEVAFVGDIMFDRWIRKAAEENSYEYILSEVKDELLSYDLVIGNLEGPVTNHDSKSYDNMFTFTFDEEVIGALNNAGIGIVSLDNNHIYNFGRDGVDQTVENLDENNIGHFGNPQDREVLYREIGGITLGLVSYNQFLFGRDIVFDLIKEARENADWVAVFAHWGDEYEPVANKTQVDLAHKFVDLGANIVIGAHPHVIQNKEKYKDGIIYYSLGNFVFDQWFEEPVRCGAVISFELEKNRIKTIGERFTYLEKDGRTVWSDCAEEVKMLQSPNEN